MEKASALLAFLSFEKGKEPPVITPGALTSEYLVLGERV
jgi:hypothetical protein